MAEVLDLVPVHHPDTAGRLLEGEAVVVTPADSHMHTLDPVGTWIWENADGERTVAQLVDALCEVFDVDRETAQRDTVVFVQELVTRGILDLLPAGG